MDYLRSDRVAVNCRTVRIPLVSRSLLGSALLVGTILAGPGPAFAQAWSDPGLGFGLQGGISKGTSAPSTVAVARLHARYRVTGVVGVEVAAGTLNEELADSGGSFLRLSEIQVTGSFVFFFLYEHPVQPYLLAGGGYYYVVEKGLGPLDGFRRTEHVFGFHAGAGVDVKVSRQLSLFLDARVTQLGLAAVAPRFGGTANTRGAVLGFNVYF